MRLISIGIGAAALAFASTANAQGLTVGPNQPTLVRDVDRRTLDGLTPNAYQTYIVRLEDAPVATYTGGLPGLAATANVVTGAERLDTNAPASRAYAAYLESRHAEFARLRDEILRRNVEPTYEYEYAFNGMALVLTAEEAALLSQLPGVAAVEKEKQYQLSTDVGPAHINAPTVWNAGPGIGTKGEGAVIAILDSGINGSHPSFADVGSDGYNHTNPLGAGTYLGYCATENPSFCNDKLIGAWPLTRPLGDLTSPEDENGHGTHVAATAGGNVVANAAIVAPTTNFTREVSGVAPHANIIAYDVCIDRSCFGGPILAALDQVVLDAAALPNGVHALNYSISGDPDPWSSATELGFLNATAAGVFVSASAGNSGPGASTVAHESPWVATVAALTHPRVITNDLTGFSSAGSALADISGVGLTTGYGPAPIVYAGDFPTSNGSANDTDPAQCLDPFPAGTFSGEIVVCDRGSIARVDKGANVLAGGAGGFVLANTPAQGESTVADPHFLPGVHIGAADGAVLRAWLAAETDTVATISGYTASLVAAAGDNLAGFSSRGPSDQAVDILKPDLGAPGVAIMAAHRNDGNPANGAEYTFLSGTSMSSPHNAGAGALLAVATNWSPYEIRSALMMTAITGAAISKEDGATIADPFDSGAGRIDLSRVLDVGIVLDETPANFVAADPATGGDPKALNIASMQDSQCVGECGWTRVVRNVSNRPVAMNLSVDSGSDVDMTVDPTFMWIWPGDTKTIRVDANTTVAGEDWAFGQLNMVPAGFWGTADQPDLHMPIAVKPAFTTASGLLGASASTDTAEAGDTVSMTVEVANRTLTGNTRVWTFLPPNMRVDASSLQATITAGTTTKPLELGSFAGNDWVKWEGELDPGGLSLAASPAPFGFFPMANIGVAPFGCPANCDDGAVVIDVPAFQFNGETYTQVAMSVNGTVEVGAQSGVAASFANQNLPSPSAPNNILAPFWTDLNMGTDGDGSEWYVAVVTGGGQQYTVYEWNNIPRFGTTTAQTSYSFQIWVANGPSGNIWFAYGPMNGALSPATVGVENADGTVGASYWFNGTGTAIGTGSGLQVQTTIGGTASIGFDAQVGTCTVSDSPMVTEVQLSNGTTSERAIAVIECD